MTLTLGSRVKGGPGRFSFAGLPQLFSILFSWSGDAATGLQDRDPAVGASGWTVALMDHGLVPQPSLISLCLLLQMCVLLSGLGLGVLSIAPLLPGGRKTHDNLRSD